MLKLTRGLVIAILGGFLAYSISSCTPYIKAGRSGKVPPGQAKKMYGQQSARDFAPGHNK